MHSFVQERIFAIGRAMNEPPTESRSPSPVRLQGMAAALGVPLSDERAAALAEQAAPHFAILRALDAIANPHTEPAAVFRLKVMRANGDG